MYRLKFRKSGAGIAALIIGAVLILAIPFISYTQGLIYDLPLAYFAGAQAVLPLFFALYTYRSCPFVQQLRAWLVTCSIIGFFGLLANNGCPPLFAFGIIQQDWLLHFNAATLGAINLGGLIAATNLMQAEQMSSFADTKVAEAQLERLKAVKVDPETQAKWEKAAAYADRSTDGRSLRSTMTNLKAISLTEPGQELKPTMRDSVDKDRQPASKDKGQASASSGEDGSLANLLDRMDDLPMGEEDKELSAIRSNPALAGNSFINDVTDAEPVDTGGSFLDSILNSKIKEGEDQAFAESSASFAESSASSSMAFGTPPVSSDLGLPAEDAETIDVAALLDSFPDDAADGDTDATLPEAEPLADTYKPEPWIAGKIAEETFEAKPQSTEQGDKVEAGEATETTRSSSFANASSSRNSMPAMQPLNAGAAPEITALSGDDTSNFPVPNVTAQGFAPTPPSSPSNTNNKLAAMKRRNTSTFTKLNALSSSGTGTLKPPEPETENEPDSLRNLLDRLDDDKVEEPAKKVEETAKPLEPPVELLIDTVFREDGTPEVAATPKAKAPAKSPEVTATEAKVPEAKVPEAKEIEPEAPAPSADEPVSASAAIEAEPESSHLASLLDRSLGETGYEYSEAPSIGTDPNTDTDAAEEEIDEARDPVFGQGVDSDIDNIFSELAPPEAQLEVGQTAVAADMASFGESLYAVTEESFPAADSLLSAGVEGEVDAILFDLDPAKATKDFSDILPGATTRGAYPVSESLAAIATEEATDEEASEAQSSLFDGGLDSEIDDIFSELAPPEAQKEVKDVFAPSSANPTAAEPAKATAKVEEFSPGAEAEAEETEGEDIGDGGLFGDNLGQELDNIFSGLTEGPQLEVTPSTMARYKGDDNDDTAASPKPAEPTPAAKTTVPDKAAAAEAGATPSGKAEPSKYKEVKEFGRLSSKPSTVSKFGSDTGGTMKTIGKLLLDVQAVENIIKSGENRKIGSGLSTAKIISAARGEGIRNILNVIDTYDGVAGSLIVGHDGLVIASTVGTGWDKDMLGALSTALLSTSNLATKKLEIGKLRQMVLITELANGDGQQFKTTVLTDVDVGILAVFLEKTDINKIDGLLETIQTTIHGG